MSGFRRRWRPSAGACESAVALARSSFRRSCTAPASRRRSAAPTGLPTATPCGQCWRSWEPRAPLLWREARPRAPCARPRRHCGDGAPLVSVECLDPVAGAWLLVPPMREPRLCLAAAALAGRLYTLGGIGEPWRPSGFQAPARSSVERFGAATGSWEVAEPMGQARCLFSAVVVSGGLPVAGGGVGHAEAA
mmetsp:Transcript_66314/g.209627  ORF Transcript_66314/g.209627 Transcript_66314/m.209627 type:complete len:192 (+) Transcript_66314:152-727(+)